MEAATRNYFEVWNQRDGAALVPLFAPEGTLRDWDIAVSGAEAVGEANGNIFKAVPKISIEVLSVHASEATRTAVAEILVHINDDAKTVLKVADIIEFDAQLRADDVLQRKLRSLPNVDVIVNALTTEVKGDGSRVTGLDYDDRATGESVHLALEGIFVQIGLLPNTEWLKGTVELSPRGEIVIDDRGATSIPGVFAAGDCTTTPYKQIVIAVGAGATASLSAFDHLIRTSAPVAEPVTV